jgi:hypothetical protein
MLVVARQLPVIPTTMNPNQKTALIRTDMRGPSRAAECFDCVVAFPAAVEQMRATGDDHNFAQTMIAGTRVAFESLQSPDRFTEGALGGKHEKRPHGLIDLDRDVGSGLSKVQEGERAH